ncbi:MAG: bis(5'-nucleosyl)-tetraphosphatase (symmetrical) YqeK [Leptospira sp.]|nr:bis(5'-nucleosyl)-tetraphosphatase (symmetrical) YqeK [Leptospira sp.]
MSADKRIAIYGGSFDPPHLGHRKLVSFLLENFQNLEKILIVPNKLSVFKREKYFSPQECFELCELNFSDLDPDRIIVSDIEVTKDSPNYSYETILEIKKIYTNYSIDLVVGEDQLLDLPHWKEFETILQEISRFIVFRRNTVPKETIPIPSSLIGFPLHICENSLWEESATQWRNWQTAEILHPPVAEKMKENSRIKFNEKVLETWKEFAKKENTKSRFDHVEKVSILSQELALSNSYLFPEKAELAGILHDITKQKTKEIHIELFDKYGFTNYYDLPFAAWHAYSGKYKIIDEGIDDIDIQKAVESHTLGRKNMSLLESILYSSDFLGSDYAQAHPDYSEWIRLTHTNLTFGKYIKSKNTIQNLLEKKQMIHSNTLDVYNESAQFLSKE